MCGIVGAVGSSAQRTDIRGAIRSLSHRGPDASSHRAFDECVLGHTRLRIIDLSPAADQPLSSEDGSVSVVFNGEIYNFESVRAELVAQGHRFRSNTDGEVLVHLYERDGHDMLDRLEGMFAFAVWDETRKRLLLGRDRLGIKPLYYAIDAGGLRFASEIRALRSPTSDLDLDALADYARLGWVEGAATAVRGVQELPPGHRLEWQHGAATVRRWSSPPSRDTGDPHDEDRLAEALLHAFTRQLVADVPVGLFLSNGVDSRVLAHLAARTATSMRTYTVGFEMASDESGAAMRVASDLGLEHTSIVVREADILESVDAIVASMDQPTVDGVNTWVISKAVREAGIVVALSGVGGDELFGGYSTFRFVPKVARMAQYVGPVPRAWRTQIARVASRASSHRLRRVASALGGTNPWPDAYAAMRGITSSVELSRLWPRAGSGGPLTEPRQASSYDMVSEMELTHYLPNQLLRDTDVMSMAHGLEVRVPLLDEAVVNAAMGVRCDSRGRSGKSRLAAAVSEDLVARAVAPKRTFTLPFDVWLQGPLSSWAQDGLSRLADPDIGFDRKAVDQLWTRWEQGRTHWRTIWGLAVLGKWVDAHRAP